MGSFKALRVFFFNTGSFKTSRVCFNMGSFKASSFKGVCFSMGSFKGSLKGSVGIFGVQGT